jgi:RHS repeat-associated protein
MLRHARRDQHRGERCGPWPAGAGRGGSEQPAKARLAVPQALRLDRRSRPHHRKGQPRAPNVGVRPLASAERSRGGITTYGYDHAGQRVFHATGSATTSYPNRYYNVASSSLTVTTTKHIFAPNGTLLATVVGIGSTTATTTYLHPDHLGGTNVTTDENGEVAQTLDYYPYGSQRISSGSSAEQRRFIGEEFDGDTEFAYLNARYYQGSRGQFMSQDPVFQALETAHYTYLADPQRMNSYAYGGNNPIRFKDPKGDDYIELGFSAIAGSYAGGFGFRLDTKGIDFFYSAGGGVGYGSGFYEIYSSGDLSHTTEFSVSRQVFGADGFGLIGSFDSSFNPDCSLCMGSDQTGEWGSSLAALAQEPISSTLNLCQW